MDISSKSPKTFKDYARNGLINLSKQEKARVLDECYSAIERIKDILYDANPTELSYQLFRQVGEDVRDVIKIIRDETSLITAKQYLQNGYSEILVVQKILEAKNIDPADQTKRSADSMFKVREYIERTLSVWKIDDEDGSEPTPPIFTPDEPVSPPPDSIEPQSVDPISSSFVKRYSVDGDAIEKHVATDKPVQNIKQDKLDFRIYVNALHSFILSKYTTTPITISIDGPWGTGKSSLMSMLKGKLDPQRDGVRKLYEWFAGLRLWWRWYFGFLKSSIAKRFGKTVISLFVRNDVDEDGIYLYFGQNNKRFHKYISDIVEGFSIDPEVLIQIANDEKKKSTDPEVPNQTGNDAIDKSTDPEAPNQTGIDAMDKSVRWWAQVHANCEPMQPPYHYAVWLNAWKFDNQEEVWASLALATMEQIKHKHGLFWRLWFWWYLTFSRMSFWSALLEVFKKFIVPLAFALTAAYYETIIGSFETPLEAFAQYGNPLLWAGFVISGILAVGSIF